MNAVALLLAILSAEPLAAGDHEREIVVDGRERSYLVHVPKNYQHAQPTPIVLIYHGAAMNGRMMADTCGMSQKADEAGFVAVYPNGLGIGKAMLVFNAGGIAEQTLKDRPDDVAFARGLLDDLALVVHVDPRRVFATGLSNGGMMSYRLAAEMANRIAAIAPVGGTLGLEECLPQQPVSVMHFHGTEDRLVPWGGPNARSAKVMRFRAVEDSVNAWVKLNGCQAEPVVTALADAKDDGTTVERWDYPGGRDGAEVVLFKVEGGGHTWPGQKPLIDLLGKSTYDISANDEMWEFFQRHPKP
ncbi:MAG: PHB depolymerase family esterase [Pirellulales bacterium]